LPSCIRCVSSSIPIIIPIVFSFGFSCPFVVDGFATSGKSPVGVFGRQHGIPGNLEGNTYFLDAKRLEHT